MKIRLTKIWFLILTVIFFTPSLVNAHTGVGLTTGFVHGFGHPLGGLDHILAMAAVGIWAGQVGGRAVWAVPVTFVCVMIVGGVMGPSGLAVPFVEEGIVLTVLILGLLIVSAVRLPLVASVAIVGLFAIFHGHGHGAHMPDLASGFIYGTGFVLSTALLHMCGIVVGRFFQKTTGVQLVRYAGGMIAVTGVYLFFQLRPWI